MKKRQRAYTIGLMAILLISITIFAIYQHNLNLRQKNNGLSTDSFFSEPVVDIIIPSLFDNNANSALNLTRGETASLMVEVFPLVNLNATVATTVSFLTNPNESLSNAISTNFNPEKLSIAQESSANTTLSITVSPAAQIGEYSVTVTATNVENASQYWGTIFGLNVLG